MAKIAVFIDGTNNYGQVGNPENTNVFKMFQLVPPEVKKRYFRGVGTGYKETKHALPWLFSNVSKMIDLAFGRGATKRVKKAYLYLALNYKPGDEVFLFGFSRGAFIARTLAGFIDKVGLLFASHACQRYVEYAFFLYWRDVEGHQFASFLRDMRRRAPHVPEGGIPVHFLGQWDTVAAVEQAGRAAKSEQRLRDIARREQYQPLPKWISHCRHALAIHDLRTTFTPLLWSGCADENTQTLRQAWFAGAHCDVGGSYPPGDGVGAMYSDIALQWMIEEAEECGLPRCATWGREAYRAGMAPHRSNDTYYSKLEPLRVRPQLLDAGQRDLSFEYLHESACARLWEPLQDAYLEQGEAYAGEWSSADKAAMRLHYRHCFPKTTLLPLLAPGRLQSELNAFHKAIVNQAAPDFEWTESVLRLVAAFGDVETWTLLPECVGHRWNDAINNAWKSVSDELDIPASHFAINKERRIILFHFYFTLLINQLPPNSATKKKLKI